METSFALKPTTVTIQNIVQDNNFISLINNLETTMWKYGWSMFVWEWSIWEAKEKLTSITNFLSDYNNLLLINRSSQDRRSFIANNLDQLRNNLNSQNNWNDYRTAIVNSADILYERLSPEITLPKKDASYQKELNQLKNLRDEYHNALKDISVLLLSKGVVDEFAKKIPEITTKIQNAEWSFLRIQELEESIEKRKNTIVAFWEEVDKNRTEYNSLKENTIKLLSENDTKTSELISKNSEIQQTVNEFLAKTIWGKSSEEFNKRADQVTEGFWFYWMTITTIFIFITGMVLYFASAYAGIELWKSLLLKISIISPLLFIDWFFYAQYKHYRQLKEDYKFKAIISWTLETFVQLLKDHKEWSEHKDFIISTANQIFQPPITQNITSSHLQKLGEKAMETAWKVIENITNRQ